MINTSEFYDRVQAFCTRHKLGRGQFGRLAVDDRDFANDLLKGRVGLRRLSKAHDFMAEIDANPARLEKLREPAQELGARSGPGLGRKGAEASDEGAAGHGRNDGPGRTLRHRDKVSEPARAVR